LVLFLLTLVAAMTWGGSYYLHQRMRRDRELRVDRELGRTYFKFLCDIFRRCAVAHYLTYSEDFSDLEKISEITALFAGKVNQ
jgi:hypothetical protein